MTQSRFKTFSYLNFSMVFYIVLLGQISGSEQVWSQTNPQTTSGQERLTEEGQSSGKGQSTANILTTIFSWFTPKSQPKNKNKNNTPNSTNGKPSPDDQPKNEGDSKDSGPSSTRTDCKPGQETEKLVPLAPGINTNNFNLEDPTRSHRQYVSVSNPNFYFYSYFKHATTGRFEIHELGKSRIMSLSFDIPTGKKVFHVPLPESIKLAPGKQYVWQLRAYRGDDQAKGNAAFRGQKGMVKYVELSAESKAQIEAALPTDQVQQYAKQNYWHEAMETIPKLGRQEQLQKIEDFAEQLNITECFQSSSQ